MINMTTSSPLSDGSSSVGVSSGGGFDFGAVLASAIDAGTDIYNNERNIKLTKNTNAQNEKLMRESWHRDDTAVQRRVADLKAAGLSPTLAAGSAAANSGAISLKAPESKLRGGYGAQTLAALEAARAIKGLELDNEGKAIANDNARLQGKLFALDVANYGLPWQLKAINSILEHLNGKNLWQTVNNIYTGLNAGPVAGFTTPGSFTFKPSAVPTSAAQKATDSAVSSGRASVAMDSDGRDVVVFETKADAKQWFLDIGGTTSEWYNGVKKYGSPEEFLDWVLGTGGWYFK